MGCRSSAVNNTTSTGGGTKTAPDFTVTTLSGTSINFNSDLKGKPLLINFEASWCGPCQLEAPVIVKAYQTYKDRIQFFGLAVQDSIEDQRAFAQKHGLEFPIGFDPDGMISYLYQKAGKVNYGGIPTTYFIDSEGSIVAFFLGPISEKTLDQKIQTLLAQEEEIKSSRSTATTSNTGTNGTGTT